MPYLTGSAIPLGTKCRVIRIPDDPTMIAAVSGALLELTYAHNWEQFGTLTPEAQADAFRDIYFAYADSHCIEESDMIYPDNFFALPHEFILQLGGAPAPLLLAGQMYTLVSQVTPVVINNGLAFKRVLQKGKYTILALIHATTASGIASVYFDDVLHGTVDLYKTPNTLNNLVTFATNALILTDGNHSIEWYMQSKRAASTGYDCRISAIWGIRTGNL